MKNKTNKIFKIILSISILIITFSSLVYLYDVRDKISKVLKNKLGIVEKTESEYNKKSAAQYILDQKFSKLILKGNYILLFRHAHREKWIDVASYDSEEVLQDLNAEETYFTKAVCLSDMGKIQANMMGEKIKRFGLPIFKVISSPSCRSRQTALSAFGKIDEINNVFMHYGPFNETIDEHAKLIRKELKKITIPKNENIIISSHGNTIRESVFDEIRLANYTPNQNEDSYRLDLDEGGFVVISKEGEKLILEHLFFNYNDFVKALSYRPKN